MARVPRYGIHNGIKYSPRRTLIRFCIICKKPYSPNHNRDKVCSDECRERKEYMRNFEKNPKYISVYIPAITKEEREARNRAWRLWYHSLSMEAKIEYRRKKNMHKKKEYDHEDTLRELRELGLR